MVQNDGGAVMAMGNLNLPALSEAIAFVWYEAELLDRGKYEEWLALWTPTSRYVVPVDSSATDFENTLNYAYDDADIRAKRVERIVGGHAVSATPVAKTLRSLSRFRILSDDGKNLVLRCVQDLVEFRRDLERRHSAELEFELVRKEDSFFIERKVVRLLKAGNILTGVTYIL